MMVFRGLTLLCHACHMQGSFNWRMKFDVELPNKMPPYLTVQMWDRDLTKVPPAPRPLTSHSPAAVLRVPLCPLVPVQRS